MTLCIAVIGTSDQSCWLAEACKILLQQRASKRLGMLWVLTIRDATAAVTNGYTVSTNASSTHANNPNQLGTLLRKGANERQYLVALTAATL